MRAARAVTINRLLVTGAAGALIAAGLVTAGEAHASPETNYLSSLNNMGIVIYDTQAALNTGYAICEAFNTTRGDVVAENLYRVTPFAEIPTREVAAAWVVVAGATLCPWHYRPERGVAL
jgi:hypothetical protein